MARNATMFPFVIDENIIDFSVDLITNGYPKSCFPSQFKNPTGPKAKKLQYEIIDEDIYECNAHMVAFKIKRDRLEAWVRALGILYYEHFGKLTNDYCVDWYDEPMQWEGEKVNRAIVIDLVKDTQRQYKITLFITTRVVQIQGINRDQFVKRDFPQLLSFVNTIHEKVNAQETELKSVTTEYNIDLTDTTVLKETNDANPLTPCDPPDINRSNLDPNIGALQTGFVEALQKITASQTTLLQQVEKSFSTALTKAITPLVESVKKIQDRPQVPVKQPVNETEKKFKNLETRITELEKTIHNLQMEKHKAATEVARLESQLNMERSKSQSMRSQLEHRIEEMDHMNSTMKDKLSESNLEKSEIEEENKKMKEKINSQFNEILELKSQLSSMFIPTNSSQQTKQINDGYKKSAKSKPTALLIGTSNIAGINAEKLSKNVDTTKIIAYTIDQTQEVINKTSQKPDLFILHTLTNEVKDRAKKKDSLFPLARPTQ